ncbi:MAG: signal peptidase I [Deltaproteobacteria bacterium]|nr:signal peptidase I [Deltaproteobacteria bacterium]
MSSSRKKQKKQKKKDKASFEEKTSPGQNPGEDVSEEEVPEEPMEQVRTLGLAVLIALAIRCFIFEPFSIPSGSMFPTLLIGDRLFVNKFVSGPKLPFVNVHLPGLRDPERGDIVVFDVARRPNGNPYPLDQCESRCRSEAFIKRVIGLPGDKVSVHQGRLTINGRSMLSKFDGETFTDDHDQVLNVFHETLEKEEGVREHLALDNPNWPGKEGTWDVPEGRYLMMGDNRDNSNDGRVFGTIRKDEMQGPAFMLYWSWDYNGGWAPLLNPLTWWDLLAHKTRWERMGNGID